MTQINYDTIARAADGEPAALNAEECRILQDVRQIDDLLAPLASDVPAESFEHLLHRPLHQIARRRFLPRCIRAFLTSSSIAAAIAIAIITVSFARTDLGPGEMSVETLWACGFEKNALTSEEFDIRADLLASELQRHSAEVFAESAVAPTAAETEIDSALDDAESKLRNFWDSDEPQLPVEALLNEEPLSIGSTS